MGQPCWAVMQLACAETSVVVLLYNWTDDVWPELCPTSQRSASQTLSKRKASMESMKQVTCIHMLCKKLSTVSVSWFDNSEKHFRFCFVVPSNLFIVLSFHCVCLAKACWTKEFFSVMFQLSVCTRTILKLWCMYMVQLCKTCTTWQAVFMLWSSVSEWAPACREFLCIRYLFAGLCCSPDTSGLYFVCC